MNRFEVSITSKKNMQLKNWRKLKTAKGRQQAQRYLIEGWHLVEEAIANEAGIETVIVSEANVGTFYETFPSLAAPVEIISDFLVEEIAETRTSQGVFAVLRLPEVDETWEPTANKYLLIDSVQDPGNLGTMIRTADAAGFDGIILGEGTVDLFNDKVVRATQGSLWHLDIQMMPLEKAISLLKAKGIAVLATALHQNALDYRRVEFDEGKVAIVVGNEGNGVQASILDLADQLIYIPMHGQAESLNVAIAAAVLMFHYIV